MARQLRIGFVGCGGNGRGHLATLKRLRDVKLVAVCDVDKERVETAAGDFGGKPYTDYRAMLDKERLDAACLSLPVFSHGAVEMAVIEHGLPFFVEKPVALKMGTARRIRAAVKKAGLITCVGYQLRYYPTAAAVHRLLESHKVGMVVGQYWCGYGRAGKWWALQMSKSGGQLVEQATHTIDMMRYLVGDVEEVCAYQAMRTLEDTDCPDANCLSLRFKNGAVGSLTATWACAEGDWSEANKLRLFFGPYRMLWTAGAVEVSPDLPLPAAAKQAPSIERVFVDAVKKNDPSRILSPYDDAVRSLAVSIAANRSAQKGVPVRTASLI